jgi:hypothetical protein
MATNGKASNPMKTLRILLAFDHELSLGGAENYRRNLFDPTDRLIALAERIRVPITLFTDVLCAGRFREWDPRGFFEPYREQLRRALQGGHDVQLHIHPHWVDSTYAGGKFRPSRSFSLGEFNSREAPNDIRGIVRQGVELLTELCRESDPGYRCVAYRAGGYNLAPETATILSALYDSGIRIESSVIKGFYFRSNISEVDFRQMPKRANWFIPLQGPIGAEADHGLWEVPIAGRPRGTWNNLPHLVKRVLYRKRIFSSGGRGLHEGRNTSLRLKLERLFPRSAWSLSFDTYTDSVEGLLKILRYHMKAHEEDAELACSTVSHPKSMGDYALGLMEGFVKAVRRELGARVEFTTYRELHNRSGFPCPKAPTEYPGFPPDPRRNAFLKRDGSSGP